VREKIFSRYMKKYTPCPVHVSGKMKAKIYCPFSLMASNKRQKALLFCVNSEAKKKI
jgi:hypothetical protein